MSVKIIQGEDRVLTVQLKEGSGCYDLTGKTEITACFNGTAGQILKTLTGADIAVVGTDPEGKITISLTDVDTNNLPAEVQGFTITVDKGTETRIINLPNSLQVQEKIC